MVNNDSNACCVGTLYLSFTMRRIKDAYSVGTSTCPSLKYTFRANSSNAMSPDA